ncbi:hypothetical protein Taro_018228, partial [Colocasia esculenta]|nr:hypothetical protein [Colocasia esculenta]
RLSGRWPSHRRQIPLETHPTGYGHLFLSFFFSFLPKQQAGAPVGLPSGVRDPRGTGGTPTGARAFISFRFLFLFCQNSKQEHRWDSHRACGTHGAPQARAPVGLPPGVRDPRGTASKSTGGSPTGSAGPTGHRWGSHRAGAALVGPPSGPILSKTPVGVPTGRHEKVWKNRVPSKGCPQHFFQGCYCCPGEGTTDDQDVLDLPPVPQDVGEFACRIVGILDVQFWKRINGDINVTGSM